MNLATPLQALLRELEARLRAHPTPAHLTPSHITSFEYELERDGGPWGEEYVLHVEARCADPRHSFTGHLDLDDGRFMAHHNYLHEGGDTSHPWATEHGEVEVNREAYDAALRHLRPLDEARREETRRRSRLDALTFVADRVSLTHEDRQTWFARWRDNHIATIHQDQDSFTWELNCNGLLGAHIDQGTLHEHEDVLHDIVLHALHDTSLGEESATYLQAFPRPEFRAPVRECIRLGGLYLESPMLVRTLEALNLLDSETLGHLDDAQARGVLYELHRLGRPVEHLEVARERQHLLRHAQPAFGDVRAALHAAPSLQAFETFMSVLPLDGLEEPMHSYAMEQLERWPDRLRALPRYWLPKDELPALALRYGRCLDLSNTNWRREQFRPHAVFENITIMLAARCDLQFAHLRALVQVFPNLTHLEIEANGCKDAAPLARLTVLRTLLANRNHWERDSMPTLGALPVTHLTLYKCALTDADIALLTPLSSCQTLDLSYNPIGTRGLELLLASPAPIEHLTLRGCHFRDITCALQRDDFGTLHTLDLTENPIPRPQAQALHDHCTAHGVELRISQPVTSQ